MNAVLQRLDLQTQMMVTTSAGQRGRVPVRVRENLMATELESTRKTEGGRRWELRATSSPC